MTRLYGWFGGRCSFFALLFALSGIVLAFGGKLTVVFVSLVGAIQALVLAHSAGQDYHTRALNGNGVKNGQNVVEQSGAAGNGYAGH